MNTIQERLKELREQPELFEDGVSADLQDGGCKTLAEAYAAGLSDGRDQLMPAVRALEVAVQALRVTYDHPLGSMVDDALKQITKLLEKK